MLTAADLHQSRPHFQGLAEAVERHRPDAVAIVGDALDALGFDEERQFTARECALILSRLPVEHLVFVRGNQEHTNWSEFVAVWPHALRPLHGLYGSACAIGPLVMVGFPCLTGDEFAWCAHLSVKSTEMGLRPRVQRQELPTDTDPWLPGLLDRLGPAARTLWLMHEPPIGRPLGKTGTCNEVWRLGVQRFAPRLVISGHDHLSPLRNGAWHASLGATRCVNVGQSRGELHFALADFEFPRLTPSLPTAIRVKAFPQAEEVAV